MRAHVRHKSPTTAILEAIVRNVNVRGAMSPCSTSSHVHGADTGAPGFARTAYAADKQSIGSRKEALIFELARLLILSV